MSNFEQRDNSGVLFKNDKREKDSQPHYTGKGLINGEEMWISAWIKEGARGKFMSLSFQAKDKQAAKTVRAIVEPQQDNFHDDSIPF